MKNKKTFWDKLPFGKICVIMCAAVGFTAIILTALFSETKFVNAQFNQFSTPKFACQFYQNQPGFTIVNETDNNCLVRNGDSEAAFIYTHFYNTETQFCSEVTSPFVAVMTPRCVDLPSSYTASHGFFKSGINKSELLTILIIAFLILLPVIITFIKKKIKKTEVK